jgi:hypothetical protein
MLAGQVFLVVAAAVRRMLQPNPTLNLYFLKNRNVIILALWYPCLSLYTWRR